MVEHCTSLLDDHQVCVKNEEIDDDKRAAYACEPFEHSIQPL